MRCWTCDYRIIQESEEVASIESPTTNDTPVWDLYLKNGVHASQAILRKKANLPAGTYAEIEVYSIQGDAKILTAVLLLKDFRMFPRFSNAVLYNSHREEIAQVRLDKGFFTWTEDYLSSEDNHLLAQMKLPPFGNWKMTIERFSEFEVRGIDRNTLFLISAMRSDLKTLHVMAFWAKTDKNSEKARALDLTQVEPSQDDFEAAIEVEKMIEESIDSISHDLWKRALGNEALTAEQRKALLQRYQEKQATD